MDGQQYKAMSLPYAKHVADGEMAQLRQAVSGLISLRIHCPPEATDRHEGELLSILSRLQFLCSDIREAKDAEDRKKIVHLVAAE